MARFTTLLDLSVLLSIRLKDSDLNEMHIWTHDDDDTNSLELAAGHEITRTRNHDVGHLGEVAHVDVVVRHHADLLLLVLLLLLLDVHRVCNGNDER